MNILNYEIKDYKQLEVSTFPTLYTISHRVKGLILPHHWHNELEFVYIYSGKAIFTIDEEDVILKAGECIFINSGQVHSGVSITDTCDYFSLVINIDYLSNSYDLCKKFFDGIKANQYKLTQHFSPDNTNQIEIIHELENIIEELQTKSFGFELAVKSKLLSIFRMLFRSSMYIMPLKTNIRIFEMKKRSKLK